MNGCICTIFSAASTRKWGLPTAPVCDTEFNSWNFLLLGEQLSSRKPLRTVRAPRISRHPGNSAPGRLPSLPSASRQWEGGRPNVAAECGGASWWRLKWRNEANAAQTRGNRGNLGCTVGSLLVLPGRVPFGAAARVVQNVAFEVGCRGRSRRRRTGARTIDASIPIAHAFCTRTMTEHATPRIEGRRSRLRASQRGGPQGLRGGRTRPRARRGQRDTATPGIRESSGARARSEIQAEKAHQMNDPSGCCNNPRAMAEPKGPIQHWKQ